MSIDALIKVKLAYYNGKLSSIKIIQMLLDGGWTFNDYGASSYLPLGEKEGFGWIIQEDITHDSLMKILEKKELEGEVVGIIMTWQDTNVGGSFLFRSNNELSINLSVNRKTIVNDSMFEITDINWYLFKLLSTFKEDVFVEFFSYEEVIDIVDQYS